MRVAVISSVHPPNDVRIFHKEATSLASGGHDVTIFARRLNGVGAVLSANDIAYIPLAGGSSRGSRVRTWVDLVRRLRGSDAEIWHFHDPELLPILVAWRFATARDVALVYDAHEDITLEIPQKTWIPRPLRRVILAVADQVERWGLRHCTLTVAATDSIGARMALYAPRVVVVRNYPLAARPSAGARAESPLRAIYVGGLSKNRGLVELVRAMDLIENPGLQLHVFGTFSDGWARDVGPNQLSEEKVVGAFEREVRAASGPNVYFHGEVPYPEVAGHLESAHIGVVTFLALPNHVEALPTKLFEYMRSGLAIVASDFPLWRSLVVDSGCGVLVDPTDPAAIAAALDALAGDPQRRREMGAQGVVYTSDRYSWSSAAEVLLEAYAQMDCRTPRGSRN